jgi:hypothetical protein
MRTEKGALPYRHTPCTGPAPLVAAIDRCTQATTLCCPWPGNCPTRQQPHLPLLSPCVRVATTMPGRHGCPPPQQRMTEKRGRGRPPQALVELVPRLIRRGGGAPTKRNWHWRTGRDGQAFASACSTTRRFSFFTLAREGGREPVRSPGQCELERRAKQPQPLRLLPRDWTVDTARNQPLPLSCALERATHCRCQ